MPWKEAEPINEKERFVILAQTGRFTVSELCKEFGINRKTGHKYLKRYVNGARKVRRVSAPEGALEKCGISPENGHVCRYETVDTNTTTGPC